MVDQKGQKKGPRHTRGPSRDGGFRGRSTCGARLVRRATLIHCARAVKRAGSRSVRRRIDRDFDQRPRVGFFAAPARRTRCAARARRGAPPGGRSSGGRRAPCRQSHPESCAARTRRRTAGALFSTPVSPMTMAFSSEPPSARPCWRSISTSFRKPNVRAGAISSMNASSRQANRARLVAQHRMVERDAVGDLEVIRRIDRDALVAARQRDRPQHLQVPARRVQPLDAGFLNQVDERRRAAVHDRHFRRVQLDDDVVDAEADERREQVLDRVDVDRVAR